jgi:leucyl/phenylalanyl-tRNA---protein transferase
VAIGGAFFAESMFHRKTDASKLALHYLDLRLQNSGFTLLEVQFLTPHLKSLGAIEIPANIYLQKLRQALTLRARF